MPRQLFERLIRENHPEKFSWEKEICHKAILEDLDAKRIRGTIQAGVNVGRIPSSALQLQDVPAQLAHFKIGGEKDGIHNAAVVLFGKEPTRFFNQCKVRLARFEGTSMRQFRDQTVCEGNLFEQYDAIINFCQKHMFLAGTMETGQRIDTLTVPFLAIRETVLNMLAHRSWWDEDESLSVAIFDDRIEFTNPGHFPIGTSVEDFIETPRSKPQNPDIANVLFRSGWMESWGRGIANIMEG
jgi:ATP-dependent DNA helicase RecG